jgi:hypothetical protein
MTKSVLLSLCAAALIAPVAAGCSVGDNPHLDEMTQSRDKQMGAMTNQRAAAQAAAKQTPESGGQASIDAAAKAANRSTPPSGGQ